MNFAPANSPTSRPWRPASGRRTLAIVALLIAGFIAGCAAQEHITRGNTYLEQREYGKAISAFEDALRVAPDNEDATDGIRRARREAVRAEVNSAREKLSRGEYAVALKHALRARRMPLDLDEVELVSSIDNTIAQASRRAEDTVAKWSDKGTFLLAVDLAEQVVQASPGVASRQEWANGVKARAVEHYTGLAKELQTRNLPGSAAIQWSAARRVGGDIPVATVVSLWDRFAEPICFDEPKVSMVGPKTIATAVPTITEATKKALQETRASCGEGTRKLAVEISIAEGGLTDETRTEKAAKALPGSGVQTTETYVEEIPYTVEEEYTEEEIRIETQERRDCAPRPGKPRGCHTWTEEVEVKTPVKKMRTVQKIRKVEKSRPAKGPFPPDKVVTYEIVSVDRRIDLKGTIRVEGGSAEPTPLQVNLISADTAHDAITHPKLKVPADPMEARSMDDMLTEAGNQTTLRVQEALTAAIQQWTADEAELARKRVQEGRLPEAEELYLRLIALGATDDPNLKAFFRDRYGKDVAEVMQILAAGMGQGNDRGPAGRESAGPAQFPRRDKNRTKATLDAQGGEEALPKPIVPGESAAVETEVPGTPDVSSMETDEMRALEEASLGEDRPAPPPEAEAAAPKGEGPEGATEGKTEESPEAKPEAEGGSPTPETPAPPPAEDEAPKRKPVVPG